MAKAERILILSGERDQARGIGLPLERAGYRVSYAHRKAIATEILRTLHPDLAIVGHVFTDGAQGEYIQMIRAGDENDHRTRIVAVRPPGPDLSRDHVAADGYLLQEFTPEEVVDTVGSLFRSQKLLDSYREEIRLLKHNHNQLQQAYSRALLRSKYLSTSLERLEKEMAGLQSLPESERNPDRVKALSELAGAISHELNQPLTIIIGRIQLLRRLAETPSLDRETLDVIEEQAKRMAEIVRKIANINQYATKPYVGEKAILDLDRASVNCEEGHKTDLN